MLPSVHVKRNEHNASTIALGVVAVGFAVETIAFVVFLTINGAPNVPQSISTFTALLIAVGLLLPASGLMLLRRDGLFPRQAKNGLALLAIGLTSLLVGVVLGVATSSLSGYLVATFILAGSTILTLLGTALLRNQFPGGNSSRIGTMDLLFIGMVLLFLGVALVVASSILLSTYDVSQVQAIVCQDVGATISAFGCVVGAYSFTSIRKNTFP